MFVNENHFWKDSASTMKIDFEIQILEAIFLKYVDFWPKYIEFCIPPLEIWQPVLP